MAHSENLATKIRRALTHLPVVEEKKMFGGIAFMVDGKMCLTAGADRMMCRTVIMKDREYKGYVYVSEDSLQATADFNY